MQVTEIQSGEVGISMDEVVVGPAVLVSGSLMLTVAASMKMPVVLLMAV
jgi:hypothetical protein